MEMELYAHLVLTPPKLGNPTIVVLTDRTDLDGQLYDTFAVSELLPEQPVQVAHPGATARRAGQPADRRHLLHHAAEVRPDQGREGRRADHPLLSDRRNIIVIVDEAHRSHYDDLDGYARHLRDALPHATLIAFTGTPISFADRNTRDGVRRLHRHLRPDPRGQRRRDGAGLLRARLIKVDLPEGVTEDDLDERGRRGDRRAGRRRARRGSSSPSP